MQNFFKPETSKYGNANIYRKQDQMFRSQYALIFNYFTFSAQIQY